jgi:hypothetical protein
LQVITILIQFFGFEELFGGDRRNKFYTTRRQLSIYIDDELVKLVEQKAKEENVKMNDIIVDAIQNRVRGHFLNDQHKAEFSTLIKSAGLYNDQGYNFYMIQDVEKKKKMIVLFYLISAYQSYYLDEFGGKIVYDNGSKALKIPPSLMEQLDFSYTNGETALALGLYIIQGEESRIDLLEIIQGLDNDDILHLTVNAFKILRQDIILEKDYLVRAKPPLNGNLMLLRL